MVPFFYGRNFVFEDTFSNITSIAERKQIVQNNIIIPIETVNKKRSFWVIKLEEDWEDYTLSLLSWLNFPNQGIYIQWVFQNILGKKFGLILENKEYDKNLRNYLKKQKKSGDNLEFSLVFWPSMIKNFNAEDTACRWINFSNKENIWPCFFIGELKEWIITIWDEKWKESLKNISIKVE